ncbi:MAG: RNA polymerase factor sigma-54 [Ruminococcaceae bacterium]|nr:RNA polymerase factor sigma-54 [Oscillospiraceae bacterium]
MAPERMKLDMGQHLRQEQHLTPQLLQSMEVLQMNSQELLEYINRAADENPMLEREEASVLRAEYEQLSRRISWLDSRAPAVGGGDAPEKGGTDWETESLSAFLCDQLERMGLEKPLLALCEYLARLVDEDGYLQQEDLDSLAELEIPAELVAQALAVVQSLEPAGVAARSLAECLLLQLQRQGEKNETVLAVVRDHLPQLSRRHYGAIARALGVSEKEVRAAEERIAALEPHPGRGFQTAEETVYVRPDLFVAELDGTYQVVLNEYYLPRLTVSAYYSKLLEQPQDAETTVYLREKLRHAQWLLYSLSQRGVTLRRCAETALRVQSAFFRGESAELAPMSMKELAQELKVHPSTVSRCLREKYLQCRQGTYPLRWFFPLPSGGVSRQAVQQRLVQLVRQEDSARPLSDEKLCRLLQQQGVEISRRTVAKYRSELGVPSASGRKRRK